LHGICGAWGGIACGIFGQESMKGLGGVSFTAQLIGTVAGIVFATLVGFIVYAILKVLVGIRLSEEEEYNGADLSIHRISATQK